MNKQFFNIKPNSQIKRSTLYSIEAQLFLGDRLVYVHILFY